MKIKVTICFYRFRALGTIVLPATIPAGVENSQLLDNHHKVKLYQVKTILEACQEG